MTSPRRDRPPRPNPLAEWYERSRRIIDEYATFVAGKTVALVGPAASLHGRGLGDLIDSHDLVVRLNLGCPVPEGQEPDLGTRTDVLYHVLFNARLARAAGQRHTPQQVDEWIAAGVKYIATRQDFNHERVRLFRRVLRDRLPLVTMPSEFKGPFKRHLMTNPNTGTLAIVHLLAAGAAKVWVTGFDFYDTGYQVGYGGFDAERAAQGNGSGNWGLKSHVPHKQEPQKEFLAQLARMEPRLEFDEIAAQALGLIPPPPSITALVPMKGVSERVASKNVRPLCGKPLLFWALDALHKARRVERVVVDTDDDEIAALVHEHHPDTVVLRRPEQLHGQHITGNELIGWELTQVEGEHFGQFHVTSPLLTPGTIDQAVEKYMASLDATHDSLFSVTEHHFWLFDKFGKPINSDTKKLVRSQDLAPIYEDNNAIHLFSRTSFERNGSRIGASPQMFPISKVEAIDIDWEDDFEIAEAVMKARLG